MRAKTDRGMKSLKKLSVIESIDNGLHHISMSHPHRLPSWDEIKWVRDKYGDPKKFYAMVLPPQEYYVNLHQFCMHLWEVKSEHEVKTWSEMKRNEMDAIADVFYGLYVRG